MKITDAMVDAAKDEVLWALNRWKDNQTPEELTQTLFEGPCLSAALAAAPVGKVKVRDLVWEQVSGRTWDSEGLGKMYRVFRRDDGSADLKNNQFERGQNYASPEEAKAAAQADYEQRILSALEEN